MTREAVAVAVLMLLSNACGATPREVAVRASLESGALQRANRCLAEPFEELRAAAPGVHPLGREASGRVGRTYELRRFRLPEGELRETVERTVIQFFQSDPEDVTFYIELEPARDSSRARDAMTPTATAAPNDRELVALRAYGAAIATCVSAALEVYTLNAGFADASGEALHGLALVDPSTRELLWFHAVESWAP